MLLKSDGFASNLYDPAGEHPLSRFCGKHSIKYSRFGSLPGAVGRGNTDISATDVNKLIAAISRLGSENKLPQIWLYALDDETFDPPLVRET